VLLFPNVKVVLPIHGERISPVFDVAKRFVLFDVSQHAESVRREVRIENADSMARTKRVIELGSHVLICGAISWPLEALLAAAGVRVVPNRCGAVDEVFAAFVAGDLAEHAFLMPGCTGRRRRHRNGRRRGRR